MRSSQSSTATKTLRTGTQLVNSKVVTDFVSKCQQGFHTVSAGEVVKQELLQSRIRVLRQMCRRNSTVVDDKTEAKLPNMSEFKLRDTLIPGTIHEGFVVISSKYHAEYELMLYTLRHVESDAEYVHIERNDDDNAFCVSFRTMPDSDNGVAHVLEHTTLCGSQKYPIKDPFFSLSGRSLNTFLNAITRPEATYYPFSTQNQQDFTNLLDVYLDAVFFPKLNVLDFKQEGIRLAIKGSEPDEEVENEEEEVPSSKHKPFIVKIGNHEIDMNEGMEAGDDPNLVNVVIEELGFDRMKMTEDQLDQVSKELQQRLMEDDADDIYSDPEASDADDKDVDMSLSSKDMGVHTGALPEAAHRAIDAAEKRDVEVTAEKKEEYTKLYKNVDTREDTPVIDYATVPLEFKGVVYNEMKGALSNPDSYFVSEIDKYLYTNSIYRHNSGGDPAAITTLTYEQLQKFHKTHYHPANACFFTYGNFAPRFKEVDEVLRRKMQDLQDVVPFDKQKVGAVLGNSDRFPAPKAVVVPGPVAASNDGNAPTKFQFSWIGKSECITDLSSLTMLSGTLQPESLETAYNYRGVFAESADGTSILYEKNTNPAWKDDAIVVQPEDLPGSVEEYVSNEIVNSIENTNTLNELIRLENESLKLENPYAALTPEEVVPNPAAYVSSTIADEIAEFHALSVEERADINRSVEDMMLSILGYLLVENPSSPLYHVLNDPNLGSGRSPGTGIDTNYYDNVFSFGLSGVRKGQLDTAASKVMDALYTVSKTGEGLQHDYTLSVLHLIELGLKDVHKGFGVNLISKLISETSQCKKLHPSFDSVKYIHRLRVSSEKYGSTYLRMLLKHHIISNPHRLLFVMQESKDFSAKLAQEEQTKLDALRAELNVEDAKQIEQTSKDLAYHQDNQGDSSILPTLSVTDIKRECIQFSFPTRLLGSLAWFPSKHAPFQSLFKMTEITEQTKFVPNVYNRRPVTFNTQPTNGVVVVRAVIEDVQTRLTPYQLSLLPFLSLLFGKVGTTKSPYGVHSQLITRHTGGISLGFSVERVNSAEGVKPMLICEVSGKALVNNFPEMIQLLLDSLTCPNFTDNVHNTLSTYAGSLATALQDDALEYAIFDANARVADMPYSSIDQYVRGLPHLSNAMVQLMRITEETALLNETAELVSLKDKPLPPGVTVPPTLLRLVNDINETMRCLLLGAAHTQGTLVKKDQSDIDYIPPPLKDSPYMATVPASVPGVVSCAPHKSAPTFAPAGFTRIIVTGDKASLASAEVQQGCEHLVLRSNVYNSAAYHPSASTLATYIYDNSNKEYTISEELQPKKALFDGGDIYPLVQSLNEPQVLDNEQIKKFLDLAKENEVIVTGLHNVRNNYKESVSALLCEAPFETAEAWTLKQHAVTTTQRPYNFISVPSQVNYVVAVLKTVDSKHPQFGTMSLLASIIETEFLHGEVREKGGAYGAYCSQSSAGLVHFMTYRDPNTLQSIESFKKALEWGKTESNLTQEFLDQAKLSMFSSIDSPTSPSDRGIIQYIRLLSNEERQVLRDNLLNCTVEELHAAAKQYLHFDNAKVTIVGNAESIPPQIEQESSSVEGKWNITLMASQ